MHAAELTLAELARWGEALGTSLEAPSVITLEGDLGAGKTTLAQSIARGYGVVEPVTSPTFALVHKYRAPRSPVFHLDLYRLAGPHQLANIGWDEAISSNAILLVEWPDRAAGQLPRAQYAITLAHVQGRPDIRSLSW